MWLLHGSTDGGDMHMLCSTFEGAERHQTALTGVCRKPVQWQLVETDVEDLRTAVNMLTTGQKSSRIKGPQHTEEQEDGVSLQGPRIHTAIVNPS